ncbi:NAD(P)/FAD-dependent oxidoreductase [Thalassotalea nanhaiensis]|uniref:Pyridine nucleotide-disulfide oxidoreductase domain-containing protein 2 n=1 Tax=Thalassotalea nanhaiensis TaxID=3065648 RepID=A0ABY9TJR5_9GAMM|nr:NAD(P)/FAD-dependent oxidoreductase [Colwelliaceae bacterium SQ345]
MSKTITMKKHYDAIVIGAGHNGLVCAYKLADKGKSVLVLEANNQVGGLAATREFSPGFNASVAHLMPQMNQQLLKDMQLEKFGFSWAKQSINTIVLDDPQAANNNGEHITLSADGVEGITSEEQSAYQAYTALMTKYSKTLLPFWHKMPPRIGVKDLQQNLTLGQFALRIKALGKTDMREFTRIFALPAQDLMDEFFTNPLLKAALSWDINIGNKLAPRSPNNALLNLWYRSSGDINGKGYLSAQMPLPKGGMGGLTQAMAKACTANGVDIICDSPVAKVSVVDHKVTGVELASGQHVAANVVISNAGAKTSFLHLLGAEHLQIQFTHRINRIRNKGMVAKLHIALNQLPTFTGVTTPDARLLITPSMGYIENAFDYAKYGEIPEHPALEVLIPSMVDGSLAPNGQHVMSVNIQYVPHTVKGGWQENKAQLLTNVMQVLRQYAPNIDDCIVASELLTPADLEQQFNVDGGHWHHGELAIDQWWMNRPTYGTAQYKTPIPGFYLCGAGAHPGGGIMGAAGSNAAKEVLSNEF